MPPPSSPHPPEEPHSASHCDEGSSSNVQLFFGIVVHVCGSVGINTGQNLQAIALSKLSEEEKKQPWKSKGWAIGCAIFISCSILNFVALTLAPASILVPLESVQFVTNVLFGKFVRKIEIPLAMWMGVLCMILGTALAVVFGAAEAYCFSLDVLISYWGMKEGWAWWLYIAITFAISVVCLVAHSKYEKATKAGKPLKWQKQLQPVAFAVPSALLGGAQMIVHSKTLAELAELAFAEGQTEILTEGFFWISLLLVSGFGIFWFYRLTVCLGMYDPLFIIPLMQACFILFGGVAGGIFFHEFHDVATPGRLLGPGNWVMYILGFAMVLYGLYLVAPKESGAEAEALPPTSATAKPAATTSTSAVVAYTDATKEVNGELKVEDVANGSSAGTASSPSSAGTEMEQNYPQVKDL